MPFPSPRDPPDPEIEPTSPALAGRFFTTREAHRCVDIYVNMWTCKYVRTYIYALIMVESEKMAVKQLKKYLKDEEYCTHKEEAESMLKAL